MTAPLSIRGAGAVLGATRVLDAIDLDLAEGERLAVVGDNGAGKSTLARLAVALIRPDDGAVSLFGEDAALLDADRLRTIRARIGVVLQGGSLLEGLSVEDNLRLGLGPSARGFARLRRRIDRLLFDFRLEHLFTRPIEALSIGERRRVELARALLRDPDLLVLDDPLDGADAGTAALIEAQLAKSLARRPRAMLLLTHDEGVAGRLCGRVRRLESGRLGE